MGIRGGPGRRRWGDLWKSRSGGAEDGAQGGERDEVPKVRSQGQEGWGGLRWLGSQGEERAAGGLRHTGVGGIV